MTDEKPRKTAAEKAQDELDKAERKVTRLTERKEKLRGQYEATKADLQAAVAERDYVKSHPALTQGQETTESDADDEADGHVDPEVDVPDSEPETETSTPESDDDVLQDRAPKAAQPPF